MTRQMNTKCKWLATPLFMGLAAGLISTNVQAQPDANNAPKGENPAAQPPRGGGGGNRPNFGNMTPAQREEFAQQRRERRLRMTLTRAGFTNKPIVDTIVAFGRDQDKARQLLQDQARKINAAMQDKATTDEQLTALLTDFRADVAAEKDRRTAALAVLDEKIGYTKKPRLDALLMMLGLTGDETAMIGGMGGGQGGGFGGQGGGFGGGGFGGGQGGWGGGQGGDNNPGAGQ